jgi:excisionase family DNA binding protein
MSNTTEKAALSVEEGCAYIGTSRPTFYRLMGEGVLRSFHIGRRRLVLKADLDRFIRERLAAAGYESNDEC